MKTRITFFAGLVLLFSVNTSFAQGVFLEIPLQMSGGLPGGQTTQIKLTSVEYGLENKTTIGSASGGAGAGRTTFNELVLTKQVDVSSIFLQKVLSLGAHFSEAKLNFYRVGTSGNSELAYQIILKTAFVSKYSASATGEGCSTGCPGLYETITFIYGGIIVTDRTRTGTPTNPVIYSWSVINNSEDTTN